MLTTNYYLVRDGMLRSVEADDAGAQEVPNPCGNCQVFGVFG